MSARQFWIAVLSVLTFLAASSVAQEKNELGGVIGRIFISDQGINASIPDNTIHSGKGLSFGGEYARRFLVTPIFSVSGEAVVIYNPDEDLNAGGFGNAVVPTDYKQLFITPAARLNLFPTTAVSPWVSLGGGFAHFSQGNMLDYGGTNPGKSTTSGVLEGGAGLDVKCETGRQREPPWRSARLLVGRAGFSSGAYGKNSPAQLFCRWWSVLAVLR